jgi:hypothetical protein
LFYFLYQGSTYSGLVGIPSGHANRPANWMVYSDDLSTGTPETAFIGAENAFTGPWLALIKTSDGARPVGFVSNVTTEPGAMTDVWWLYEKYVEVAPENKSDVAFSARQLEGAAIWQLMWSEATAHTPDDISITLRSIGPASNTVMRN